MFSRRRGLYSRSSRWREVYISLAHSWFYGYRLPPTNLITSTTNLSIQNLSVSNDITALNITGDIFDNLEAGVGISLSQNTETPGKTIISAAAAAVEGFTKSTEYAFQVTGTGGNQQISNPTQSDNGGTVLNFTIVEVETPDPVYVSGSVTEGYDTTLKQYIIPVSGYYQFGFKAYIQNASDDSFRIGIYQSGTLVGQGGRRAAMTEDFTIILNCEKGECIDLRGHVGTADVYMGVTHSWFWGHKLTPANNLITSTTDLIVKNVETADMIVNGTLTAPNIKGFTQSIEYAFHASSNSGIQTLVGGNIINFDLVQLETPPPITVSGVVTAGYSTTLNQYIVPTDGIYAVGFNMYYNNANFTLRIGIYKNGVLIASGGNNSSTADSVSTVVDCEEGEWINIKVVNGGGDTVPSNCSFWGYKLNPANNLITSTTDLTVKNLTVTDNISATTLTGDIGGNLAAAYGIELATSLGVTSITTNPSYFFAILTENYPPGDDGTQYTLIYNDVPYVPAGFSYSFATGVLTVNNAGTYEISASVNMDVVSWSDRVTLRARLRINGSWTVGLPQSYAYMRHQSYGMYGTSSISPVIQILNAGDTIDISCNVNKGNITTFDSTFLGVQFLNGCNILVKRLH